MCYSPCGAISKLSKEKSRCCKGQDTSCKPTEKKGTSWGMILLGIADLTDRTWIVCKHFGRHMQRPPLWPAGETPSSLLKPMRVPCGKDNIFNKAGHDKEIRSQKV